MHFSQSQVYSLAVVSGLIFVSSSLAQTATPAPVASPSASILLAPAPAPVPNEADKKGKKVKPVKETPLMIEHGVLSVDGWPAKADLNYVIADIKFLYVWAPGVGTFVISNKQFPGSTIVKDGFDASTLTVQADKHTVQVVSDRPMLSKKKEDAFVVLDRGSKTNSRYPRLGYGDVAQGPYAYPGSRIDTSSSNEPPLPASMRPAIETKTTCETLSDGLQGDCKTIALTMPAAPAPKPVAPVVPAAPASTPAASEGPGTD